MHFFHLAAFGLTVANLVVLGLVKADSSGKDEATSAFGAQVAHLDSPAFAEGIKTVVYTVAYGPAPALYRTDKREINGATNDKYETTTAAVPISNEYLKREVETVTETVTVIPDYCTPLLPVGLTTSLVSGSLSTAQTTMNPVGTQMVTAASNETITASVPIETLPTAVTSTIVGIVSPVPFESTSVTTESSSSSSSMSTAPSSSIELISTTATTVPKATPTIASGASGSPVGSLAMSFTIFLALCTILAM